MGHRLPAAGVPTLPSEHFQFYQVTPMETRCRQKVRVSHTCTLRPRFIAQIFLNRINGQNKQQQQDCREREKIVLCCRQTRPSESCPCVGQSDEIRYLQLKPVKEQPTNNLLNDVCRRNAAEKSLMCRSKASDCKSVIRKPYILWKNSPHCHHKRVPDGTAAKSRPNEEWCSNDRDKDSMYCHCEEQVMHPPRQRSCCSVQEDVAILCPRIEYVPVIHIDSRPPAPFYGKRKSSFS
ncbi:hypothetical protein Btru_073431 [Bulinus truncatus]|nr:hypothetical protein Btru_073431 [Bulinus truncatus]